MSLEEHISICQWSDVHFLFFSNNIWGDFIYYSHLLPVVSTLLLIFFLFLKVRDNKAAQALLFTSVCFVIWTLMDLFLWASDQISLIMFVWSAMVYLELLIYVGILYFIYAYINEKFLGLRYEILLSLLFVPLLLFAHTSLNLSAFDLTNCWREAIEGPLWRWYVYPVEIALVTWILLYSLLKYHQAGDREKKTEIAIISIGVLLFLFMFSIGNIVGSIESDWEIGQIGLFGMPVLLGFISYVLVRYQAFRGKVFAAQALFSAAFILLFSTFFVRTIENVRLITLVTLTLFAILGFLLVRNVKREIEQREEIERLADNLRTANKRLKVLDRMKSEFVSIASHQLRSPLTSIRGYTSMILEGSYGKLTPKLTEVLENINDSAKYMAMSVEDYLNVSRIESGNMKYEMSTFDLRLQAEKIVDEMRNLAMKRGLVMIFRSDCDSGCKIRADIGKTRQIIMNILDNSIKYTEKGTITVIAHDDVKKKKMYVTVHDTGVGMDKTALEEVFDKFVRAKNANCVNVNGSGLGLYVAKKMVTDMDGRVWAESEGEGKGSIFHIEFPLAEG